MKALLLTATALTLMVSAPAFADGNNWSNPGDHGDHGGSGAVLDTSNSNVTTNIAQVCKVNDAAGDITVHTTVNDNGQQIGQISSVSANSTHASLFCNVGGSQVKISHTPMTTNYNLSQASQNLGFTKSLDYNAQLSGATEQGQLTIDTMNGGLPSSGDYGVYYSDMTLSINNVQQLNASKKPVAGAYNGVVTITLSAS